MKFMTMMQKCANYGDTEVLKLRILRQDQMQADFSHHHTLNFSEK